VIYYRRGAAFAGGLISYGTDLPAMWRELGLYAGRILKGEKPATMPVSQVTKMRLVINMKTAKTLGITFPTGLLVRADEVIE
jgi:putative tryptophan/tyrosine transport system substrate-binding protein